MKTHKRPDTPGWQLVVNLANDFVKDEPARETGMLLSATLLVRENEKIPDDHFDEVMRAMFDVGLASVNRSGDVQFPYPLIHFFDTQMGREDFTTLAAKLAPDWEVVDHDQCDRGYALFTTDRQRLRKAMERDRIRDLLGHLAGEIIGFPGASVMVVDAARQRSSGSKEPAEPVGRPN